MRDRVSELIRACSREVVRRRVLKRQNQIYRQALIKIKRESLDLYIDTVIDEAILQASLVNPDDYGRP